MKKLKTFETYLFEQDLLSEADKRSVMVDKIGLTDAVADKLHNIHKKHGLWIAKLIQDDIKAWDVTSIRSSVEASEDPENPDLSSAHGNFKLLTLDIPSSKDNLLNVFRAYQYVVDNEKTPEGEQAVNQIILDTIQKLENDNVFAGIFDWVKNMNGMVNLNDYSLARAIVAQEDWHDSLEATGKKIENETGTVLTRYDDGHYWIDLEKNYDPVEAAAMGHCGNCSKAITLYSLRKDGVPAVTMAVGVKDDYGKIVPNTMNVYRQLKGTSNSKPLRFFHPYIADILMKKGIDTYNGAYNNPTDFHYTDVDDELFKRLLQELPAILRYPAVRLRASALGLSDDQDMIMSYIERMKDASIQDDDVVVFVDKSNFKALEGILPYDDILPYYIDDAYKKNPGDFILFLDFIEDLKKKDEHTGEIKLIPKEILIPEFMNVLSYYAMKEGLIGKGETIDKSKNMRVLINNLYNINVQAKKIIDSLMEIIMNHNDPIIYIVKAADDIQRVGQGVLDDEFYKIELPLDAFRTLTSQYINSQSENSFNRRGSEDGYINIDSATSILSNIKAQPRENERRKDLAAIKKETYEMLKNVLTSEMQTKDSGDGFDFFDEIEVQYEPEAEKIMKGIYHEQRRHRRRIRNNVHRG